MAHKKKSQLPSSTNDDDCVESGDIVISGLSGKLPESSNIEEFKLNLLNGIDMVTDNPRRWEAGKLIESKLLYLFSLCICKYNRNIWFTGADGQNAG